MQRKILTFRNEKGEIEDLIPYVDDLSIQIGGTNLRDYLAQIEENLEIAKKYLGAFESETVLLSKYPDGSDLPEGVYAIVTDIDALYIYDTDGKRWLRTAGATLGILQLNGLTPINGSLTITGGDIQSTVSNADTTTQTVTNHLDNLYSKAKDLKYVQNGLVAIADFNGCQVDGDYAICKISVDSRYKNCDFISFTIKSPSSFSSSDRNKLMRLQVTYSDGTVQKGELYSSDVIQFTMDKLNGYLGLNYSSQGQQVLVRRAIQSYVALNITLNDVAHPIFHKANINTYSWTTDSVNGGYKANILAPTSPNASGYNVISVSKKTNGKFTTAVIDYEVTDSGIYLYSDEKFEGTITFTYKVG